MKHLIDSLRKKGKLISPASVAVESLFHTGGTVTEDQAREYLHGSANVADVVGQVAEILEGENLHLMGEYCRNIQRHAIARDAGKEAILQILTRMTKQGYYQEALNTVITRIKAL